MVRLFIKGIKIFPTTLTQHHRHCFCGQYYGRLQAGFPWFCSAHTVQSSLARLHTHRCSLSVPAARQQKGRPGVLHQQIGDSPPGCSSFSTMRLRASIAISSWISRQCLSCTGQAVKLMQSGRKGHFQHFSRVRSTRQNFFFAASSVTPFHMSPKRLSAGQCSQG